MRQLAQRCAHVDQPHAYLRMDFDARQRARSRVIASNGDEVGIHIERGTSLKDGDCLISAAGDVYMVRAAAEPLSLVSCDNQLDVARAAYHLGNRHVRLQIEPHRLSYQSDHVLDDMVQKLGFQIDHGEFPFEPEPGAYHRPSQLAPGAEHTHHHGHGHTHHGPHAHHHDHTHDHEHDHGVHSHHDHTHGEHGRDHEHRATEHSHRAHD